MTPLDWYVLVFSPIAVLALAAVPIALARRDARRPDRKAPTVRGHIGTNWHAPAAE